MIPSTHNVFNLKQALKVFCILLLGMQLYFVWHQAWSPIDEYAHMDYIEKLSLGKLPAISDTLCDDIVNDIWFHPERNVNKQQMSRRELGLGNYSYQAKHPPLYYTLLTLPNSIMKSIGLPVFERVQYLRVISHLLVALGLWMFIPIGNKLRLLGYHVPTAIPWMAIAFCLLFCSHERYGLGNNLLSILAVNSSLYMLCQYMLKASSTNVFYLALLSGLSVTVSLSNVFVLPIIFILALPHFWRTFSFKKIIVVLSALSIPIVILVLWQIKSKPDPQIGQWINQIIKSNFKAGMIDYASFLDLLLNDMFTLSFLHVDMKLSTMMIFFAGINLIALLGYHRRLITKPLRWLGFGYGVFIYFLILLFVLNRYVGEVTWVAFRHYMGFLPFVFLGLFSFLILLPIKSLGKLNSNQSNA